MITIYSENIEANNTAMPSVVKANELYIKLLGDSSTKIRERIRQDLNAIRNIDWNKDSQTLEDLVIRKK